MSDSSDPAAPIREQCANSVECRQFKNALEECNKRVQAHPGSRENCEEELYDFLQCVDHCSAAKVFNKLK